MSFFKTLNTILPILRGCQTLSLIAGYQINAQMLESRKFRKNVWNWEVQGYSKWLSGF